MSTLGSSVSFLSGITWLPLPDVTAVQASTRVKPPHQPEFSSSATSQQSQIHSVPVPIAISNHEEHVMYIPCVLVPNTQCRWFFPTPVKSFPSSSHVKFSSNAPLETSSPLPIPPLTFLLCLFQSPLPYPVPTYRNQLGLQSSFCNQLSPA
jgi:hypothetical protein